MPCLPLARRKDDILWRFLEDKRWTDGVSRMDRCKEGVPGFVLLGTCPELGLAAVWSTGCSWRWCERCGAAYADGRAALIERMVNEEGGGEGVMLTLTYPHGELCTACAYAALPLWWRRFLPRLRRTLRRWKVPNRFSTAWAIEAHQCGHPHIHAILPIGLEYADAVELAARVAWIESTGISPIGGFAKKGTKVTRPSHRDLCHYANKHFGRMVETWPLPVRAFLSSTRRRVWHSSQTRDGKGETDAPSFEWRPIRLEDAPAERGRLIEGGYRIL